MSYDGQGQNPAGQILKVSSTTQQMSIDGPAENTKLTEDLIRKMSIERLRTKSDTTVLDELESIISDKLEPYSKRLEALVEEAIKREDVMEDGDMTLVEFRDKQAEQILREVGADCWLDIDEVLAQALNTNAGQKMQSAAAHVIRDTAGKN